MDHPVGAMVRIMQIIVIALATGVVIFGGVAFANAPEPDVGSPLVVVGVGFAIVALAGRIVAPMAIGNRQRRAISHDSWKAMSDARRDEQLCSILQVGTLVGGAIPEGAAMLCLVAYMQSGQIVCFAAAVVMLIAILSLLPTQAGVGHWIERQKQIIELGH